MNIPTHNPKTLDTYEAMLKETIDHFLVKFHGGCSDFSDLVAIFFRLIQTMPDPPLEFIWFYSALTFHTSKSTHKDFSREILISKDLFHSLVSFPTSSNGLKKVSVLAPLLFRLYNLMCDFSSFRVEIEGLLGSVFTYIIKSCCDDLEEQEIGFDKLRSCFLDLIPVWTIDLVWENCGYRDELKLFFPLLSDDIRRGINVDCKMGYLSGVVMIEAFLLMLCLKFDLGVSREELHKDVQSSATQIIKVFSKHWTFLDMLLRLLLEPSLPVTNLLSCEDEVLLRKALFDAVLLEEDDSFLSSNRFTQLPDNHFKNLVLLWLFVADTALQFVRENGDQTRIVHYLDAFSISHLPNQLINWVTHQSSMELTAPDNSTPEPLINWLLVVENQGIKVFDRSVSELHAKAVIRKSRVENEVKLEENEVCGDQEMVDSLDNYNNSTTSVHGRRKREENIITCEEGRREMKLVKYSCESFDEKSVDDGLSSGSEVDNPAHGNLASDQVMEGI